MELQSRAADVDRFLVLPRPPALFGELRKRNRRRILLDPASKVVYSRVIRHLYEMVMVTVVVPTRPWLSVIVNLTVNVPAALNVWLGLESAELLAPPDPGSPKFHEYVVIVAPPNVFEPAELKPMSVAVVPVLGENVMTGTGSPLPTITVADFCPVAPLLSVTTTLTTKVPGLR